MFLRNVRRHQPSGTASHSRKTDSSQLVQFLCKQNQFGVLLKMTSLLSSNFTSNMADVQRACVRFSLISDVFRSTASSRDLRLKLMFVIFNKHNNYAKSSLVYGGLEDQVSNPSRGTKFSLCAIPSGVPRISICGRG
jgi:hypothetical protein